MAPHPNQYFGIDEHTRQPVGICRARMARIQVCEHRHITYRDLEYFRVSNERWIHLCTPDWRAGPHENAVYVSLRKSFNAYHKDIIPIEEQKHINGKPVQSISLCYTFPARVFDHPELDRRHVEDWQLCPHVRLSQIVRTLHPDALEPREEYICGVCFAKFRRHRPNDLFGLIVTRDLGYGRGVPDALWLTAIGMPPRRDEARKLSEFFKGL